jgi:hypothetical protein
MSKENQKEDPLFKIGERDRVIERTNVRYRGINFVIEIHEEFVDFDDPDKGKQFWAKLDWPRGTLAEKLEEAGRLVGVEDYRFEYFTCYTCRGRHRSQGDVFDEAASYIKETIDYVYDRAIRKARKNADMAEQLINYIREELTTREWMK